MLFNSLAYAVFFPIVFALFWIVPQKYKWVIMFIASYYFYMSWNPKYVVLILGTTVISYYSGILLEKAGDIKTKKLIVTAAAVICLGVLFVFKYFNFAVESFCRMMGWFSVDVKPIALQLLLPVGISFYTFQTMAYVIDVYRGTVPAEHHFGYYATFISFFPQLVAGPIERTSNLLPQIKGEKHFNEEQALDGVKIILWGFFKKIVIADMIGVYVDMVYDNLYAYSGFSLLLVSFFFTLQIYCDFSGYSSIAIGSAKLMGIELMQNFRSPYYSASIKEFWSRWHISLSTWFKDYLYIPMGGNRVSRPKYWRNMLVTFMVSGIWHGASWTFIIWGAIHGVAQVIENMLKTPINKLKTHRSGVLLSRAFVFFFCLVAWVFFRAKTLPDAAYVIGHLFSGIGSPGSYIASGLAALNIGKLRGVYIFGLVAILAVVDLCSYKADVIDRLKACPKWQQWLVFMLLALVVVLFSRKGEAAAFVYFQF